MQRVSIYNWFGSCLDAMLTTVSSKIMRVQAQFTFLTKNID